MAIGAGWAAGAWIDAGWVSGAWALTSNDSPTAIALTNYLVDINGGLNSVVGAVIVTDPDVGDTHTISLVAGTGDTDNASFGVSGSDITCNDPATLGYGEYSIRIQADDGLSTPYSQAVTLTVVQLIIKSYYLGYN